MSVEKFIKQYTVRSYECDRNNNLRLVTLMNIFQDIADEDANQRGFGLTFCLKNNMTWVGVNYILDIKRLPKIHENISINSWPSARNKLSAYRDFEVYGEDGNLIIVASSQWALIDITRKRPVSVIEKMPLSEALSIRAIDTDFPKIAEPERIDNRYKFRVRFDDIDLNRHINNAIYILWAVEAVEPEFRLNHNPAHIEINFRKEGYMGEKIIVHTQNDALQTSHSIRTYDSDNERELARAIITWQPL